MQQSGAVIRAVARLVPGAGVTVDDWWARAATPCYASAPVPLGVAHQSLTGGELTARWYLLPIR